MSTELEILQLTNGDIVLREADDDGEALVQIRFSDEVRDMLGDDIVGVAEAMIEAATDFLEGEASDVRSHLKERGSHGSGEDGYGEDEYGEDTPVQPPVVH